MKNFLKISLVALGFTIIISSCTSCRQNNDNGVGKKIDSISIDTSKIDTNLADTSKIKTDSTTKTN